MPPTPRSDEQKLRIVVSIFLLFLGLITMAVIASIWTGDSRWGQTAGALAIPGVVSTISALIGWVCWGTDPDESDVDADRS